MTVPAKVSTPGIMESVLIAGDLSRLTEAQRIKYYDEVCKSMGLNPLTKPFEYITLNGKLQLYALRACTDQLRKINGISLEIVSRDVADGILTVHVRAKTPDGRTDEDFGSVPFPDTLKGEFRANMQLKAVTKAKRRATLSICGLGWLDETEVEDIPSAAPGRKFLNPSRRDSDTPQLSIKDELNDKIPEWDDAKRNPEFGPELHADAARSASGEASAAASPGSSPPAKAAATLSLEDMAREAARRGPDMLREFFNKRSSDEKKRLREIEKELIKLYPPPTAQHREDD